MENSRLREAAPTSVNVTVGRRGREYLTDREVERLIEAAKQNDASPFRYFRPKEEIMAPRSSELDQVRPQSVIPWRSNQPGAQLSVNFSSV